MIYLWFSIFLFFNFCFSQQYYDQKSCSSNTNYLGTRYTCTSSRNPCRTFIVYRANIHFPTISSISSLFKTDSRTLLRINKGSNLNQILKQGYEVLIPITCSCLGNFSRANLTYTVPESTSISAISCEIFEGLVTTVTLFEDNLDNLRDYNVDAGVTIRVPLKCACPDNSSTHYLITYPLVPKDSTRILSKKFSVSIEDLWNANHLMGPDPTVYPNTTLLVPLEFVPSINYTIPDSDPPTTHFYPKESMDKRIRISEKKRIYIAGSVVVFVLTVAWLIACSLYIKALRKSKSENLVPLTLRVSSCSTPKSSPFSGPSSTNNSCLSPDVLISIKYSLSNYSIEEVKQATDNFGQDAKIGDSVYKGLIDNSEVIIKEVPIDGTKQVIDVHSKINHVNIVKLDGVCYAEDDLSCSYLVFEFPFNGSLRDCLARSSAALHWHRRTQVAFDIATGLHYLHYSVTPSYTHLNLNSNNVFLTSSWRAKLAVFGSVPLVNESGSLNREKDDIFALGIVLLELLSGTDVESNLTREGIRFLGSEMNDGGCFDELRSFIDPCLTDDYPLAEALCLAVLAGSCIEHDPLHRPSVDHVLKILARMV